MRTMSETNKISPLILFLAILAACSLLLPLALAAPANASGQKHQELREWFTEFGVERPVQNQLIKKLEEVGAYDSMLPGEQPVSTENYSTEISKVSVSTFSDGSISVTKLEKPEVEIKDTSGFSPMSIDGCSATGGAGWASYSNCSVNHSNGTISLAFKASYERYAGAYGQILNVWSPSAVGRYGSMTAPSLRIVDKSGNPAVARMKSRYTSWNGASEFDCVLSLRVSASGAWTTTY